MPRGRNLAWIPVAFFGIGGLLLLRIHDQARLPLRQSLTIVPSQYGDFVSTRDLPISPEEQRVAGMDSYISRLYTRDSTEFFSIYVGYYESQTQGRTIHSPKNCLPGGGWEPVSAGSRVVPRGTDSVTVNRYVIENKGSRAIVYYWYQGRGRVAWNEYAVKWDLIRDKALYGRSEEALVRLVIPVAEGDEEQADRLATEVAGNLIGHVAAALPADPGVE